MNRLEAFALALTIAGSIAAALMFIWKMGNAVATMQADLKSQIVAANHERSLNDVRLEHLQQSLTLGFNGMREKFEHFSSRSRMEMNELDKRLACIENFLAKSTEFEKR